MARAQARGAPPSVASITVPSLRAEQVEATRGAILASARRLFGASGYYATSIDDIARDARVTKGAVYHHFDTKEQLFRHVYVEVEGEAQARTGRAPNPSASPIDQLVQGVQAYLDATLDPEVQRITLIDAPGVLGLEPDGPANSQPGFIALREFIAEGMRTGAFMKLDAGSVAHLIRGACLQAGLLIAHSDDSVAARKRVGAVLEVMIRALGVHPAQPGARPAVRSR